MTLSQALKLILPIVDEKIQRLAFDAQMRERFRADYPAAVEAAKKRRRLREAREVIKAEIEK